MATRPAPVERRTPDPADTPVEDAVAGLRRSHRAFTANPSAERRRRATASGHCFWCGRRRRAALVAWIIGVWTRLAKWISSGRLLPDVPLRPWSWCKPARDTGWARIDAAERRDQPLLMTGTFRSTTGARWWIGWPGRNYTTRDGRRIICSLLEIGVRGRGIYAGLLHTDRLSPAERRRRAGRLRWSHPMRVDAAITAFNTAVGVVTLWQGNLFSATFTFAGAVIWTGCFIIDRRRCLAGRP